MSFISKKKILTKLCTCINFKLSFKQLFLTRFGRVSMMLLTEIMVISIGIATAYVQSVAVFIVLRTVLALFIQAGYIGCFVYGDFFYRFNFSRKIYINCLIYFFNDDKN